MSRQQLYNEAFLPMSRLGGTIYPCTTNQLDDATTPNSQPPRRPMRRHQAVLNPTKSSNALRDPIGTSEYNVICRLEKSILAVFASRHWTPDLIIKAFCDLDCVSFCGSLRRNVYVQWQSARSFAPKSQHRLHLCHTAYLEGRKAVIYLNADGNC